MKNHLRTEHGVPGIQTEPAKPFQSSYICEKLVNKQLVTGFIEKSVLIGQSFPKWF